jgi:hypothetical protein
VNGTVDDIVGYLDPFHILAVSPIGLSFGYISCRSDSIIPAMLAHAYNNPLSLLGIVYDQIDSIAAWLSAVSNQVVVALGLHGLLGIIGYLIATRLRSQATPNRATCSSIKNASGSIRSRRRYENAIASWFLPGWQ